MTYYEDPNAKSKYGQRPQRDMMRRIDPSMMRIFNLQMGRPDGVSGTNPQASGFQSNLMQMLQGLQGGYQGMYQRRERPRMRLEDVRKQFAMFAPELNEKLFGANGMSGFQTLMELLGRGQMNKVQRRPLY